jgi:hypothetical protein
MWRTLPHLLFGRSHSQPGRAEVTTVYPGFATQVGRILFCHCSTANSPLLDSVYMSLQETARARPNHVQSHCLQLQDIILGFRSWLNRCRARSRTMSISRLLRLRTIRSTCKFLAVHSSLADELVLALDLSCQPSSSRNAQLQRPILQYLVG